MATGTPSYKVILHGEYGVGKSSIFRRFMNDSFTTATGKQSTIGLDQSTRTFKVDGGQDVKLTLWDTGGMERMSFIGSSYYRGANAALLCYSVNKRDTFTILSQYILDIVMNAEGAKIFLCGNMADQAPSENDPVVTDADLEQFTSQCEDVLSGVYRVSCKDCSGLSNMFADMARVLHRDAMSKMTLRRGDWVRPGDTPEREVTSEKKGRCC